MAYSYVTWETSKSPGDTINVPYPYLQRQHVVLVVGDAEVASNLYQWTSNGTIECLTGFPPGAGRAERRTPRSGLPSEQQGSGSFNWAGANENDKTLLYIQQEVDDGEEERQAVTDGLVAGYEAVLDAAGDFTTAAATSTAKAAIAVTAAGTAVGAASAASSASGVATTKASEAAADRVSTGQDRQAVAADRALTNADVVSTHADVVLTHADVVLTHADVVLTHADRAQTNLDRTAAAQSASDAASAAAGMQTMPVQINLATDADFADADMLTARKASDGTLLKRSWTNVKALLKTYFDAIYSAVGHGHSAVTGAVNGFMLATDKIKLDGIATGATANSADAALLNRANHTGTQAVGTLTGVLPEANGGTGASVFPGAGKTLTATNVGLGQSVYAQTSSAVPTGNTVAGSILSISAVAAGSGSAGNPAGTWRNDSGQPTTASSGYWRFTRVT